MVDFKVGTTATATKTSPQTTTLLYIKSFAIIPSRSRPTIGSFSDENGNGNEHVIFSKHKFALL